jgi:hypothetical protein
MARKRIAIIVSKCRRCGKPLATASRSIWGADAIKKKYELICDDCLTPEEKDDMFQKQVEQVKKVIKNG